MRGALGRATILTLAACCAAAVPAVVGADVRGTVEDAASGQPLPGANVALLGTVLGTVTGVDGAFRVRRVSGPPSGQLHRIRVTMIGYRGALLDVADGAELRVLLAPEAIALNPVVVTADRRAQSLDESSQSISVLSAADLAARTNLRLDDALEMVPGVHFVEDDINIRGATGYRANAGSRVLLLLDGVPVIASDTGGLSWDLLAMQDVERVEIVKGAGSALYGSGAIGGVVNVITRRPTEQGVLTVRTTAGLYGDPSESEWQWAQGKRLTYSRAEVGYARAFGATSVRVSSSRYGGTGDRQDADFNKWTLSGRVHRQLDEVSELELYAAWLRDRSSVFVQWRSPYQPDSTDSGPAQLFHPLLTEQQDNRLNLTWINTYARYARTLSAHSHVQVRASLLRSTLGNQFDAGGAFSPAYGPGLEVQLDWLPAPAHYVTVGIDGRTHLTKGKYFLGDHRETAVAVYGQDEWRLRDNVSLSAGARLDRNAVRDGAVIYQINPRFGLNWRPRTGLALRASVGRGFRMPTVAERSMSFKTNNFQVVPSEHLDPERSWSYEAGLRKALGTSSYLDAAVFQNDYSDFIEPQINIGQTGSRIVVSFLNVADARIRGAELSGGTRFWQRRLQLEGGVTLLDSEDLEQQQPLAYRPRWSVQLRPSVHAKGWHTSIDYRYASRFERVAIYNNDQRVAQHELGLRVSRTLGPVTVSAGVNNALNYNYTQLERNLGEIRSFVVGASGTF